MYLMVASLKKQLGLDMSMGKTLQILSLNPFQQLHLDQLLTQFDDQTIRDNYCNQLIFNEFQLDSSKNDIPLVVEESPLFASGTARIAVDRFITD